MQDMTLTDFLQWAESQLGSDSGINLRAVADLETGRAIAGGEVAEPLACFIFWSLVSVYMTHGSGGGTQLMKGAAEAMASARMSLRGVLTNMMNSYLTQRGS